MQIMEGQSTPNSSNEIDVLLQELVDVGDQLARTPRDAHNERIRLITVQQHLRAKAAVLRPASSTEDGPPQQAQPRSELPQQHFASFTLVMWVLMGLSFLGIQLAPCGDFIFGDEDCPALGFVLGLGILAFVWGIGLFAMLFAESPLASRISPDAGAPGEPNGASWP